MIREFLVEADSPNLQFLLVFVSYTYCILAIPNIKSHLNVKLTKTKFSVVWYGHFCGASFAIRYPKTNQIVHWAFFWNPLELSTNQIWAACWFSFQHGEWSVMDRIAGEGPSLCSRVLRYYDRGYAQMLCVSECYSEIELELCNCRDMTQTFLEKMASLECGHITMIMCPRKQEEIMSWAIVFCSSRHYFLLASVSNLFHYFLLVSVSNLFNFSSQPPPLHPGTILVLPDTLFAYA